MCVSHTFTIIHNMYLKTYLALISYIRNSCLSCIISMKWGIQKYLGTNLHLEETICRVCEQ